MSTPPEQPLVPPSPQGRSGPPAAPAPQPQYPAQYPPQAWGPPPAYPGWAPPATDSESATALRSARTALGWAIGAAVGAGLSLVLTLLLLVSDIGAAAVPEDGYYGETLRGEVVGLPDGAPLGADRLEHVLGNLFEDYGIDHDVQCPDTAAVSVSTVVVCTGEVDGYEWTGVVVFEDTKGSFAVVEI
ncbi:hypothetical protein [Oryzobacter telluris]|uniref:hypothetical protein n=1 Tax=Oryzobacter telluris TaxID=3149179 RepID=UPI00370D7161